jgi:hypothetical protein
MYHEKIAGDGGLGKSLRKKSGTTMERILPHMSKKVQRQSHNIPRPVTFGKLNTMLKRDRENSMTAISNVNFRPDSNLFFKNGPAIIVKNDSNKKVIQLEKSAALKIAESIKHSDIFKDVNSLPMGRAVPMLVGKDPDMPRPIINRLAKSDDLGRDLGQMGGMGIVLKPSEFQRTLLMRAGQPRLADELDDANHVFDHNNPKIIRSMRISVSPSGGASPDMMEMLRPILEHRSAITPIAVRRISIIKRPMEDFDDDDDESSTFGDHDFPPQVHGVLSRIGGMYNGYRSDLLDNIESLLQGSTSGPMMSAISKMRGGDYLDDDVLQSLYAVPLAYFSHAYWNKCCCDGRTPEEFAMTFTQNNPNIARYLSEFLANKCD